MRTMSRVILLPSLFVALGATTWWVAAQTTTPPAPAAAPAPIVTVPGMPGVPDRNNLYSETVSERMSPAVAGALPRVYVPNRSAHTVSVIDPATLKVIDTFKVGIHPQHVVPSWDLKTLWVANNAEGRNDGSLTPVDPLTGKPGPQIMVEDPYNMYWSPDGKYAIVVAEAFKRLDFRDVRSINKIDFTIPTPLCAGINHADFSIDGRYALFTCEFGGAITKIDLVNRKVLGTLRLTQYYNRPDALAIIDQPGKKPKKVPDPAQLGAEICTTPGMPQDVRASPDGKLFYVADMMADGVHVVDGETLRQVGFVPTGVGAHGLYPSRDGKKLYVANRGSNQIRGKPKGPGSVSVLDFASGKVEQTWPIPGGGSPDMGNVSADGKYLWLSGRYDNVVYRIDTASGAVDKIKVGAEPHGLTVWPQPGRYSLGHTGNLR
ncbi:YncE family protein [Rivibacter subsaxonicus]|uniref:YVTN family beta-propeller protein n=1 Tax=Rivibacter subsaxonicus TaxID=457575 RepID=A0A4Q7W1K2_9BURK|nr:YVTN family beta-propeller protein [Rivibacter subsaxonicus]